MGYHVDVLRPRVGHVDVVRRQDDGLPGIHQGVDHLDHLGRHPRIQSGRRLVQYQYVRIHGERTRQRDPLPLSVGQVYGGTVAVLQHPDLAQRVHYPPLDLLLGKPHVQRTERHILLHGGGEYLLVRVLDHHAHRRPQFPEGLARVIKGLAFEQDLPLLGFQYPVEGVEQRRLPGPVRPEYRRAHAFPDRDGHPVQGFHVLLRGVGIAQIPRLQYVRHADPPKKMEVMLIQSAVKYPSSRMPANMPTDATTHAIPVLGGALYRGKYPL